MRHLGGPDHDTPPPPVPCRDGTIAPPGALGIRPVGGVRGRCGWWVLRPGRHASDGRHHLGHQRCRAVHGRSGRPVGPSVRRTESHQPGSCASPSLSHRGTAGTDRPRRHPATPDRRARSLRSCAVHPPALNQPESATPPPLRLTYGRFRRRANCRRRPSHRVGTIGGCTPNEEAPLARSRGPGRLGRCDRAPRCDELLTVCFVGAAILIAGVAANLGVVGGLGAFLAGQLVAGTSVLVASSASSCHCAI